MYILVKFIGTVKKFGVEQILCVLCALCGEKSCTAKHAKSAKLLYARFNTKRFYTHSLSKVI